MFAQPVSPIPIGQHRAYEPRQSCLVGNLDQAAGIAQQRHMVGEIAGVRPDRDCTAQTRGFQRVLPATLCHQAAPHEGDRGKAVPEAQFAHRIGDPDAARRRILSGGATRSTEFGRQDRASIGMARLSTWNVLGGPTTTA